jgi:hypothetical protein
MGKNAHLYSHRLGWNKIIDKFQTLLLSHIDVHPQKKTADKQGFDFDEAKKYG